VFTTTATYRKPDYFLGGNYAKPCVTKKLCINYYAFGSPMTGRTWVASSTEKYSFGFNGKLNTDEIYGEGNVVDFGARIYDSRLGRWFSTDPLQANYSAISPYVFSLNDPISNNDPNGLWVEKTIVRKDKNGNIKKWYQFWIKTSVKEITYTIHCSKMYFGANDGLVPEEKQQLADDFKENFEEKSKGEYKTLTGKTIKQKIVFAGKIEVIEDLSTVVFKGEQHDQLFYMGTGEAASNYNKEFRPKDKINWLGMGTVGGNVAILNLVENSVASDDVAQTGVHEFLHNLGLAKHSRQKGSLFFKSHKMDGVLKSQDLKRIKGSQGKTDGTGQKLMNDFDQSQKKANEDKSKK